MAEASRFRRLLRKKGSNIGKGGIKKRKGLRGGMWAKKGAIGAAYNVNAMRAGIKMGRAKKPNIGAAYGYGHAAKGAAIGQFAKRYPKTQFGIQAGKVAAIAGTGAWILNDDDMKS